MLREVKALHGAMLRTLDGEIGRVNDILFDDEKWTVRYLVVDTGSWLFGRQVLIAPGALGKLEWDGQLLNVNLTREQIEKSPGLGTDEPVSRQFEATYYDYFGWPYYWGGFGMYGGLGLFSSAGMYGGIGPDSRFGDPGTQQTSEDLSYRHAGSEGDRYPGDSHLRSTNEVTGYAIAATDGHLGHVEDFIFDDESWRICYLAVDTRTWWPGKKALLPLECVNHVSWHERTVSVKLMRDQVRNGPEWNSHQPISKAFENELSAYHSGLRLGDTQTGQNPTETVTQRSTSVTSQASSSVTHDLSNAGRKGEK